MEEESQNIRQQVLKNTLDEAKATDSHTDPCVICLDSISERAITAPCRHDSFDFLCLVSWLQERSNCPLCKTEVHTVEYSHQSPQGFKTYTVPKPSPQIRPSVPSDPNRPLNPSSNYHGRHRPLRRHQDPHPQPPITPDAALLFRRHIYRQNLYSLHVGSNRLSRFRDLTPSLISHSPELITRARAWIRRELQVFEFLNSDGGSGEERGNIARRASNAEFLLEYIVAILKTVDIKGSGGQAEDLVQEFLGRENARLLLHELRAWLRSPYRRVEDWDRHVQYRGPVVLGSVGKGEGEEVGIVEEQWIGNRPGPAKGPVRNEKSHRYDRYVPYTERRASRPHQWFPSDPG